MGLFHVNEGIPQKVILLSAAIFFADASWSSVIPIFPGFAQKIGASLSVLGSYGSVAAITMLLLSIPFGRLSDRLGRKKMMTPGLIIFILVPLSYMLASSPLHLYPIRIALGLGGGLIFRNGFLLITEVAEPRFRRTAQGMIMTSQGLGFTVGPFLGGFTAKIYGTNACFLLSSVFAVLSIVMIQFVRERERRVDEMELVQGTSIFSIIRDPRILAAGFANYLNSLMFNALIFFFPVYGVSIGFDESEVGIGFTTRGLASTAVRLPLSTLAKHVKVLYLMVFGLLMSALTIFSVSMSTGLIMVSALLGIQGIAFGIFITSGNIYIALNSEEKNRGTAMAVYSMFGNVSGVINPVIMGVIAETLGPRGALQFSTSMALLGLIPVYYMASRNRSPERSPSIRSQ
jgi:MFS family permease